MSSPATTPTQAPIGLPLPRPTAVVLFRTPVPPSQGTDPYHDAFGPFCLPSFPFSALDSGSSTPLPPTLPPGMAGAEHLKSALSMSATGKRRGRWIDDEGTLTTHHLAKEEAPPSASNVESEVVEREFCVTSIPILGHKLTDVQGLAARIMDGPRAEPTLPQPSPPPPPDTARYDGMDVDAQPPAGSGVEANFHHYRGVIVTSQRAVEAWGEAVTLAARRAGKERAPTTVWSKTPFFAVGPATSAALRNLAKEVPQPFRPSLVMGGGATGTGEALANFIIRHFNGYGAAPPRADASSSDAPSTPPPRPRQPPLLLLVGDKNLPTIPTLLSSAEPPLEFEVVQAYETCLDPNFAYHCDTLSRSLPPPSSRPGSRRASRSGSSGSSRRPSTSSLSGRPAAVERRPSAAGFAGGGLGGKASMQAQAMAGAAAAAAAGGAPGAGAATAAGSSVTGVGGPASSAAGLGGGTPATIPEDADGVRALGSIGTAAAGQIPVNLTGNAVGREKISAMTPMTRSSSSSSSTTGNAAGGESIQGGGGSGNTGGGGVGGPGGMSGGATMPVAAAPLSASGGWPPTPISESPIVDDEMPASSDDALLPLDSDIGLGTGPGTKPDWLVFFSPSGANYALSELRARGWLPPPASECKRHASDVGLSAGPPEGYPRIGVLGPTTKKWVREQLGWAPDAVAASPGPAELREAIRVSEKRIRREMEKFKEQQQQQQKQEVR